MFRQMRLDVKQKQKWLMSETHQSSLSKNELCQHSCTTFCAVQMKNATCSSGFLTFIQPCKSWDELCMRNGAACVCTWDMSGQNKQRLSFRWHSISEKESFDKLCDAVLSLSLKRSLIDPNDGNKNEVLWCSGQLLGPRHDDEIVSLLQNHRRTDGPGAIWLVPWIVEHKP